MSAEGLGHTRDVILEKARVEQHDGRLPQAEPLANSCAIALAPLARAIWQVVYVGGMPAAATRPATPVRGWPR